MREEEEAANCNRRYRGLAVINSHLVLLLCLVVLLCARGAGSKTLPYKRGAQSTSSSPGKIVIKRMSERMLFAGAATIGPPQQLPTLIEDSTSQLSGRMSETKKSQVEWELKSRAGHNHHHRRHRNDPHIRRRRQGRRHATTAESHAEITSRPHEANNRRRRRRRGHHQHGQLHRRKDCQTKGEEKGDGNEDKEEHEDEDEEEDEGVKFKGSVEWLNEEEEEGRWIPGSTATGGNPGASTQATSLLSVKSRGASVGFNGIDHYAQRYSGAAPWYNNSQLSWSPPDVAMCMGRGYIVEIVNSAIAVYNSATRRVAGVTPINQFLGLRPAIQQRSATEAVYGDKVLDPTCVYDVISKRFFMSALWLPGPDTNAYDRFGQTRQKGSGKTGSGIIVASSQPLDPTKQWSVYFIPATNDGTNSNADSGSPLFFNGAPFTADYPQIGVDTNGVYISVTHMGTGTGFVGSSVYGIPKGYLARKADATIMRFGVPSTSASSDGTFVLQPARQGADLQQPYDRRRGGTMYFLSTVSATGKASSSSFCFTCISLWALTNTSTMGQRVTSHRNGAYLQVQYASVPSYCAPVDGVDQKNGPAPLAAYLNRSISPVAAGDLRVLSVTYSMGRVLGVFNVGYGQSSSAAIALVRVTPSFSRTKLSGASADRFQIAAVAGSSLLRPSLALDKFGRGIVSTTLVGPSYFPSAAYVFVSGQGSMLSNLYVVKGGTAPLDDYTAYAAGTDGLPARFGDFHAVSTDEAGNKWAAVQYIAGGKRAPATNWATYIFKILRTSTS